MAIREDQVRRVATLARLRLGDDEMSALTSDLGRILDYVDKLAELDTSAVEPTSHVVAQDAAGVATKDAAGVAGTEAPYREDEPSGRDDETAAEEAVANAPRREGHFFAVPPIIE